ncbi:MAG: Hsp70 family protein [Egibacteraceae bacterium]
MGYGLGIDFGTMYTAAAVLEHRQPEIMKLGEGTAEIPSVLFYPPDGPVLTGDAANRRAATEPDCVTREFKRRIGDPTPLIVGGKAHTPEALSARLLRWVVDSVEERQGKPAERIAITHPANWGPYKRDLLRQAVRTAGIEPLLVLTEPEAAAISYASTHRMDRGDVVAVYDLGGGTFDTAVLRKRGQSFELLGLPQGIERLGGLDFDGAILSRVDAVLDGALGQLDPEDPAGMASVARLRRECVDAKEALSRDTEVLIPVLLPDRRAQVRLTRDEFEEMIRPEITHTIEALRHALDSARIAPDGVSVVLLVGGSSRIPLVAEMVSAELGRPVAVDAHPKHAVALGAALAASVRSLRTPSPDAPQSGSRVSHVPPVALAPRVEAAVNGEPRGDTRWGVISGTGRGWLWIAAVGALVVLALSVLLLRRPAPGAPSARIGGITVQGDRYVVDWESVGFTSVLTGFHVHFFFDTVPPDQAGRAGQGPWWEHGAGRPFTGFGVPDRPPGASQLCVLVANPDHTVRPGSGGCAPLP